MEAAEGPVRLRWTPRPREYAEAHLARAREVTSTSARWWVVIALAVLGGALLPVRGTSAIGIALLVVAAVPAFARVTQPLLARRYAAVFAANSTLGDTQEVVLTDDGLHSTAERWSTRRSWSTFSSWTDAPHAWVLATSDTPQGHLLPLAHAGVVEGDAAQVRALLERHLGPPLGAGRRRLRVLPWVARAVVVAAVVVPLAVGFDRTHAQGGEWALWPSEAPPLLEYQGVQYVRIGGDTARPVGVPGVTYTPGGGLVLAPLVPGAPSDIWVLAHDGDVSHYVAPVAGGPST